MNFKQQLHEAYKAGYRQSIQENVNDVYEAYEQGQINEEQLNEFLGFLGKLGLKGLAKLGLKFGDDAVKATTRRPVVKKPTLADLYRQQTDDFVMLPPNEYPVGRVPRKLIPPTPPAP